MENLFIKHANVNLDKLAKAKQFLEKLHDQLRVAFVNLRGDYKYSNTYTELYINCHPNPACGHTFRAMPNGVVEVACRSILMWERNATEKALIQRLLKKHPKSRYQNGHFYLNIDLKEDSKLDGKIKDLIIILTKDGFVFRR